MLPHFFKKIGIGILRLFKPHKPVHYTKDYFETHDGSDLRYAFLGPETPYPQTMVVLTGRSEYIEEYKSIAQSFSERGFNVFIKDWRGQGASERTLNDESKGHIDDYETYIHDLDQFMTKVIFKKMKGPIFLFAHSMGGHIALRYLEERMPSRIKAVILSAPMIDIKTAPYPRKVAEGLTAMMMKTGNAHKFIFGEGDFDPAKIDFENNPYTSDYEKLRKRVAISADHQDNIIRGYTFGWLNATLKSIKILEHKDFGKNIKMPVLLLTPGNDQVVNTKRYLPFSEKLINCTYKFYEGARHVIMEEKDHTLERVWSDIDAFLKKDL